MNRDDSPLLMTYREAANLLGVSDRTIWRMVDQGELPAVRFAGRTVRVHRTDLESFIERAKGVQLAKRE